MLLRFLRGLLPFGCVVAFTISPEASERTVMSLAGHISREMLEDYSHMGQEAKRRAVESLDNDTITSQLAKWEEQANRS